MATAEAPTTEELAKKYKERFEAHEREEEKLETAFPDEHRMPLRGLLFLGKLEREESVAGHTFLMHTLTEGEIIEIGILAKSYAGTRTENEAQMIFTLASCITHVDGVELCEPISPASNVVYDRAQVIKQWYPGVCAQLYKKYLDMEKSAVEITRSLKN